MAVNGYIRQSASQIVTGATIQASHFNNEYNAIETAFSATIGHNHDGTTGGGQTISAAGLGLTPTAGALVYSGSSSLALTTAGTASQLIQSNGTAAPTWTTATYPSTISTNQLVLGTGSNAIGTLATAANSVLTTNASSVVSWQTILPATNMPALTGDVTSSAGATATTIANSVVTYAKLQTVAGLSVIGNSSSSTATAVAISGTAADQVLRVASNGSILGFGAINLSGTGAVTGTLAAAQFPALTGDVTTSAGSLATTIATNAVTNAKAAQMAAQTIKGNNGTNTANASDLTVAQTQALLSLGSTTTAWSPTDASGAGLTFGSATTGGYTVIGNIVFVFASVVYPATGSGSAASIGGLPFTVPNKKYAQIGAPLNSLTVGLGSANAVIFPVVNTTTTFLINSSSGAQITNSGLSGLTINFGIWYPLV